MARTRGTFRFLQSVAASRKAGSYSIQNFQSPNRNTQENVPHTPTKDDVQVIHIYSPPRIKTIKPHTPALPVERTVSGDLVPGFLQSVTIKQKEEDLINFSQSFNQQEEKFQIPSTRDEVKVTSIFSSSIKIKDLASNTCPTLALSTAQSIVPHVPETKLVRRRRRIPKRLYESELDRQRRLYRLKLYYHTKYKPKIIREKAQSEMEKSTHQLNSHSKNQSLQSIKVKLSSTLPSTSNKILTKISNNEKADSERRCGKSLRSSLWLFDDGTVVKKYPVVKQFFL